MMQARTEQLLKEMFYRWERYRPQMGYPRRSAGLSTGGRVQELDDWEDEIDNFAIKVTETAWSMLGPAERIAIEVRLGRMPQVATVREGVYEEGVRRIELKLRAEGIL